MEWKEFLDKLNTEYKDIFEDNPNVEVYGANDGTKYKIVDIYNSEGLLCIDIEKET